MPRTLLALLIASCFAIPANATTYNFKQYVKDLRSASCTLPAALGGGTLADGGAVTAFAQPFVPFGSTCVTEQRVCSKGTLSGSYLVASCQANPSTTTWDPNNRWQNSGSQLTAANAVNRIPLSADYLTIGEGGYSDQTPYGFSTAAHSTGKWYFEYVVLESLNQDLGLGIGTGVPSGFNLAVYNGNAYSGLLYGSTTGAVGALTYGTGSRVMMAVDLDSGKLWVGANCTWSSGNPATGATPNALIPAGTAVKAMWHSGGLWANGYHDQVQANFGGSAFGCAVPAGFTAGF